MKPAAFCLLLAVTLSAQAISEDSAVSRLRLTLNRIKAETIHEPVSLVIAVQTNDATLATLASVRDLGLMLQPLVTSDRGEIAILSYGDQVRTVQPFTSDSANAALAIAGLKVNGTSARKIDAVGEAISYLDMQPSNRQRVILVVGQSKDQGSETNLTNFHDAMIRAQRSNVLIYSLAF